MSSKVLESDFEEWRGYIYGEIKQFHDAGNDYLFNPAKIHAAGITCPITDTGIEGVFTGAWHVVRKYLTTELIDWLELRGTRITFSQWQARRRADREEERNARQDYLDSAESCLDQLEELRRLIERRDELIMTARERGATWREIGESVGLKRAQLHNIATRHTVRLEAARRELAAGIPGEWIDSEPF